MSIQILGLREYGHAFFKNNWRAPSVIELFQDLPKYLGQVPPDERWNIYYTACECIDEKPRELREQKIIPFDIDGIDVDRQNEVITAVCEVLEVNRSEIGIIFSGNGLQLIVGTLFTIQTKEYFDIWREHYRAICDRINLKLKENSLMGHADPAVFSAARLLRMPGTLNIKPDKPRRQAQLINSLIVPLDFKLEKLSRLPVLGKTDFVSPIVLKNYPHPDTEAVLDECEYLKWCKANPNDVKEPQWYAELSIIARLDNGAEIAHEYSRGHKNYSSFETTQKLEQAAVKAGPRTCKNINTLWPGCVGCKHHNTELVTPLMIQGPDYIKTQNDGFYHTKKDKNGDKVKTKPCYSDLRKYFEQKNNYLTLDDVGLVHIFNGTHWDKVSDLALKAFSSEHFDPKPDNKTAAEFVGEVYRNNLKPTSWFDDPDGKINFANGVLDIETEKLLDHSPEFKFKYVLPYNYDPEALAPRFEKFLEEITLDRKELWEVILEFLGYAVSNDPCWTQQSLLLVGAGANGKSTLLEVIKNLVGKNNYSALTLSDLKSDTNRAMLDGKLVNLAEETAPHALQDSSYFKNLVTGGDMIVKLLWKQPFSMKNKAKLIFACNELPESKDATSALLRRMIIIPFDAYFENGSHDPRILTKLLPELPGIFNLALSGYKRLKERGEFSVGSVINEQISQYSDSIDNVKIFSQEIISVTDKKYSALPTIYRSYEEFVESRGELPIKYDAFFRRLKKMIPNYGERKKQKTTTGGRVWALNGVELNSPTNEIIEE